MTVGPESHARTMPLRAVLWDLDGTLIDSSPIHCAAYATVLSELGLPAVSYARIAGQPTRQVFRDLGLEGARLEEAVRRKQRLARERLGETSLKLPGADDVLDQVRSRQLRLGLVSGASRAAVAQTVTGLGWREAFEVVVCGDDPVAAKPHPEPFFAACQKLDVFPTEALAVEDSESGLRAARAAGVPVWAVHAPADAAALAERSFASLPALASAFEDCAAGALPDERSPVRFAERVRLRPRRQRCVGIVPAAGRGTRLGATGPKILHEINGEPILLHLYRQLSEVVDELVIVASPGGGPLIEDVTRRRGLRLHVVVQPEPVGMADAVWSARTAAVVHEADQYLIVWGDQVTLQASTVQRLMTAHDEAGAHASLAARVTENPYIHFERDTAGRLLRVLQRREGDPMPRWGENDCGVFLIQAEGFFERLASYIERGGHRGPVTGEINFLPFLTWPGAGLERVLCLRGVDPRETLGVNTQDEAVAAGTILRQLAEA